MDQCDSEIDLVKYMWVSDLSWSIDFALGYIIVIDFYTWRNDAGWGIRAPLGTCSSNCNEPQQNLGRELHVVLYAKPV